MDEKEDFVPALAADSGRQSHVVGERMAVVETKVNSVQDDLRRIGNHIHTISQAVTKIEFVEQKCLEGLRGIGDTVDRFETRLEALLAEQTKRQGIADFGRRLIVGAGAALAAILGTMGAGLIWLSHALKAVGP